MGILENESVDNAPRLRPDANGNTDIIYETVSSSEMLIGVAKAGTPETTRGWKIQRIVHSGNQKRSHWANNLPEPNFKWSERSTLFPLLNTYSVELDGINDYLLIADDPSLAISPNLTVSAWVKGLPSVLSQIASKFDDAGSQRSWRMGATAADKFQVVISDDGTLGAGAHKDYETPGVAFSASAWTHLAFTFAAGTLTLYVNGVAEGAPVLNNDGAIATIFTSTADLLIGARLVAGTPAQFFPGFEDETSIWSAALTATEITELYNSGTPANLSNHSASASLSSWWRMGDNDIFPNVLDNIGSNDAVMTNMTAADIAEDTP